MNIIILSCCVSFITLFILFFRKKKNKKMSIPTWFLGSQNKLNLKYNFIFSKPPLLPFFLIIIATLLAAYIYFPRSENKDVLEKNKYVLIWFDPSLSAQLSRMQSHFPVDEDVKKIRSISHEVYGLSNDFSVQEGKPTVSYHIENLDSKEKIAGFISRQLNTSPSPFHQSLETNEVSHLMENTQEFKNKKGTFLVFSDGKESSLFGTFYFKKYFYNAFLIKSPSLFSLEKINQEIIPRSLAEEFDYNLQNKASDFILYDEKMGNIPEYLRPQLVKTEYRFQNKKISIIDELTNRNSLPLIFACTDSRSSFIELDPFASIRELSLFFHSLLVEKPCNSKEADESAMKFRKGAIWIVPLTKEILQGMNNDLKFFTPQNFNINIDSLVYVAPSFLSNENFLQKNKVQLDKGSFPLVLNLAPFPPSSDMAYELDNMTYKGKFKLVWTSEEGIPLAWKSSSLPFFYLRTGVSSPNAELSRSNRWIHFWFEVAKTVKNLNSYFTSIELTDVNKMQEEFFSYNILENLDVNQLVFQKTKEFTLGLYSTSNPDNHLLLTTSVNYNEREIEEEEFNSQFQSSLFSAEAPPLNQNLPVWLYIAYGLFVISLFSMWYIQRKEDA